MILVFPLWCSSVAFSVIINSSKYSIMSKVVGKVVDILRGRSQPPKRTSVRPTVSKHYDGSRMNT